MIYFLRMVNLIYNFLAFFLITVQIYILGVIAPITLLKFYCKNNTLRKH